MTPASGLLARPAGIAALAVIAFGWLAVPCAQAQPRPATREITTPKEQFGHDIGDDYVLVNYTQYASYLRKVDRESDRMSVVDIGTTEEGRPEVMAIITSPDNQKQLARYKEINRRLALADSLTDDQARQLARDGKTVVWIDGGLHATEVLGAQQLIETIYRLNAKTDAETLHILDDVIILCVLVNPDGMEVVSNWYMREPNPQRRSTAFLPRLYQKYAGHDNNRDFYMMNMSESANASQVMYREWYPAIVYNHHQSGPAGAVLFAPPFRDPFNYNVDPLVVLGIDMVGAAIHTRLAAEGKPGAVMRTGAPYSTWFNGGLRTTSYFHNQIGILTEMIGNPTPVEIPFVLEMQLPRADVPNPIAPQTWRFRQSVEYSVTSNYAILDIASKRKEDFLFNMYKMGKNAIDKGNRDTWTIHPRRIEAARRALEAPQVGRAAPTTLPSLDRGRSVYESVLRDPTMRDPRGFILSAQQPDFPTATKFVNALIKAGVVVHRATAPFTVAGKSYPSGSYVVKAAQVFRAHLMDMFEPQDHPDDIPYPGGEPRPPYDATGYNLAYSMGIQFDRVLERFDGPYEALKSVVAPQPGEMREAPAGGGYLISHDVNDAFVVVNRLLRAGQDVFWLRASLSIDQGREPRVFPAGTMYVPATATSTEIVRTAATDQGVSSFPIASAPLGEMLKLRQMRIGLWDVYGGSMPSGWTRWLFEQYEFPFEVVYSPTLDAGDLNDKFDVLVFVNGAIPMRDAVSGGVQPPASSVPAEYRSSVGRITVARTVPRLREFIEKGGTVLTIGSSTALGYHLNLPIRDALVERGPSGAERSLPTDKFYIPGSLLVARVDNSRPLAWGMPPRATMFYDESPAFRLQPEAAASGVTPIAWYENGTPLRSGWAWGQRYLDQAVSIVEARVGKGHLVLFGNEIAWRAQSHGSFKLLFNGIYYASQASN
ncbi:MAG: M14 metallopeptidase family protein [Vicinamibacterales bacterium]